MENVVGQMPALGYTDNCPNEQDPERHNSECIEFRTGTYICIVTKVLHTYCLVRNLYKDALMKN